MNLLGLEAKYGKVFSGDESQRIYDALVRLPTLPFETLDGTEDDDGVWDQLIRGYREAGDYLVRRVESENAPPELLVYPVVVLYRHYLELSLKHLYVLTGRQLHESIAFKENHGLLPIWETVRARLPRIPGVGKLRGLEAVALVVGSFAAKDKGATNFRYPDNVQASFDVHERINLVRLRRHIERAGNELDSYRVWLVGLLHG